MDDGKSAAVDTCCRCGRWMGFEGANKNHDPKWEWVPSQDWICKCPWCGTGNIDPHRAEPGAEYTAGTPVTNIHIDATVNFPKVPEPFDVDLDKLTKVIEDLRTAILAIQQAFDIAAEEMAQYIKPLMDKLNRLVDKREIAWRSLRKQKSLQQLRPVYDGHHHSDGRPVIKFPKKGSKVVSPVPDKTGLCIESESSWGLAPGGHFWQMVQDYSPHGHITYTVTHNAETLQKGLTEIRRIMQENPARVRKAIDG